MQIHRDHRQLAIRDDGIKPRQAHIADPGVVGEIPAIGNDPITGRCPSGTLLQSGITFLDSETAHVAQPMQQELSQRGMNVRIDDAGQYRAAGKVDHPGARTGSGDGLLIRSRGDDLTVGEGHGLCPGATRIGRIDLTIAEHERGGVRASGPAYKRCQQDDSSPLDFGSHDSRPGSCRCRQSSILRPMSGRFAISGFSALSGPG